MGALPFRDGLSATTFPSGVRGTPVETIEAIAPVIVWQKEYAPDTGGAGTFRGGLGVAVQVESSIGQTMRFHAAHERIVNPPRGAAGGGNGAPGSLSLRSGVPLKGKGLQVIPAGERLVVRTPGGGGFGEPDDRSPAAAAADQRAGFVRS